MSTSEGNGKRLEDNAGISEGIYYLKLSLRYSMRSGYGRKCSFSSEGDSHVFVEIFSVLIVCVTRRIGCYQGVEDFVRQSHLTNVGGLKTAGFLMLVEGSGIGS